MQSKHTHSANHEPVMAPDVLSLIAISSLAYIASVALHEHLGHTAACVLLGGRPAELGAFYVDCDDARLSDLAVRSVALAGPVISLVVGLIALGALDRTPAGVARYFTWLLGSIGLMTGSGYLGGTAGLLFMWHRLGPCTTPGPTIVFSRRWDWIAIALVLIGAYAAVLGPTLHP